MSKTKPVRLEPHEELLIKELRSGKKVIFSEGEKEKVKVFDAETDHQTGNKKITIESDKPLSPKEIEELAQVDNLTTFVARTWLKSHKSGVWLYSIDVRFAVSDFYTKEQFKKKLQEIMPDVKPVRLPAVKKQITKETLLVYIADDHCGAINEENDVWGNKYNKSIYAKRLSQLAEEIKGLNKTFSSVYIINLGDELDSYNQLKGTSGLTTRGGHTINSETTKTQFDIYVASRIDFYSDIFNSGISDDYTIVTCNNSNHTGVSLSYMTSKALEFYINGKYPQVRFNNIEGFIDYIQIDAKTVVSISHGKDDKFMRSGFPMVINDKIDNWLLQWFASKGFTPEKNNLYMRSGDLHQWGVSNGNFGSYMKIPSVYGSSTWIGLNFGNSKPGATLEVFTENKNNSTIIPVWF